MGFVLSGWYDVAMPDLPQAQTCPAGLQTDNNANWEAQFPTEELRKQHIARFTSRQNRGPNGENVWYVPDAAEDPLPFRDVQGDVAVGLDLDGLASDQPGAGICPHTNFRGPAGERNVDNQLYRVTGCMKGFRKSGMWYENNNRFIRTHPTNRILIEISEVDDERNDDHVVVTTYKGSNKLVEDARGNVLPWQSQRIDDDAPEYVNRMNGRIVNGVLTTDPIDVRWPVFFGRTIDMHIKGMRLQVTLSAEGADGVLAGYQDIAQYWENFSKKGQPADYLGGVSAPSVWRALWRYADGAKDPVSGKCTAISAATAVAFTRALIVHPESTGGE